MKHIHKAERYLQAETKTRGSRPLKLVRIIQVDEEQEPQFATIAFPYDRNAKHPYAIM